MKTFLPESKKCSLFFLCLGAALVFAAFAPKSLADDTNQTVEVIPPIPAHYFNDYASAVSPATTSRLNSLLENYERESSDQIVVAIYPKMQSSAPINEYTRRIANTWGVGQKGKNNGMSLFVFIQDRKMYVIIGTGLEKALPDDTCKSILDTQIAPHLKKGDFDGGLTAGVTAFISATKGAYHGNGQTVAETKNSNTNASTPAGKDASP
jgi:uncharacterized protein